VSAAIIVLTVSAYVFSSKYYRQYPIEHVTADSSFACDVTIRNAQFSTTIQKRPDSRSSTKYIQAMFDMLNTQTFTLNIDLVQTAFTCDDSIIFEHLVGYTLVQLPISNCQASYNESILSLAIPLPTHAINLQLYCQE
jgi:hypothetical protein